MASKKFHTNNRDVKYCGIEHFGLLRGCRSRTGIRTLRYFMVHCS